MRSRFGARGLLAVAACAACTDVTLMQTPSLPPAPHDNKLSLSGQFCTADPAPAEFPLRVLFVVDTSQSMNVTDPPPVTCTMMSCFARRAQGVLDVLNAYPAGGGIEYALETFSSSDSVLTVDSMMNSGFTDDTTAVKTKLPALNIGSGETNYEGALAAAFQVLQADMVKLNATARSRARYVVIFMSDGLPAPVTANSNTPQRILNRVKAIKGLETQQRLADVQLHTVFLAGPTAPPQVQLDAQSLLSDMAVAGTGTFRTFQPDEPVRFFYVDFRTFIRTFNLKKLIVTNLDARQGQSAVDSDGDGLADSDEIRLGTNPALADTDGDGFNDLLEVRLGNSGFDPLFPGDADCRQPSDRLDDDGDGLLNCEERFIGTNPRLMDSDADGVPDDIEFRFGTNPVANDALEDPDFDGADNVVEVAAHTDPQVNDSDRFSILGYRYQVDQAAAPPGQKHLCYTFTVDNITLAPTLGVGKLPVGTNNVVVRVASTPEDAPEDFGTHSIACVRPRYREQPSELKEPASGKMRIPATSFKKPAGDPADPEVFNADRDCIAP